MAKNIYVGVGGKARHVKALYVGVGGKARKVKKVYVGVNGQARLAYTAYIPVTSIRCTSYYNTGNANGSKGGVTDLDICFELTPSDATNKQITASLSGSTASTPGIKITDIRNGTTVHVYSQHNWNENVKLTVRADNASCSVTVKHWSKAGFWNIYGYWGVEA